MRKEQVISTTNNNQMEEKGMKKRFIHFKKRFVPALSGALMGLLKFFIKDILLVIIKVKLHRIDAASVCHF